MKIPFCVFFILTAYSENTESIKRIWNVLKGFPNTPRDTKRSISRLIMVQTENLLDSYISRYCPFKDEFEPKHNLTMFGMQVIKMLIVVDIDDYAIHKILYTYYICSICWEFYLKLGLVLDL